MDNYYLSNNIPEVFKIADKMMEEKYPQPKKVKKPRKVPMPDIKSNPNVEGPLYVTEEWYNKKVAKREKKIKKMHIYYFCAHFFVGFRNGFISSYSIPK